MKRNSQREQIKDWLTQGHPLNQHLALVKFGCMRLPSRIDELRQSGLKIITTMVKTTTGKRIAQYTCGGREMPVVA